MEVIDPMSDESFIPTTDNTRLLRDAFGQFATGVTVVTAQSDQGPVGMTANSFSSVSLDPALVLWCPGKSSKRYAAFASAQHYAIHVLSADQADLCWQIARDGYTLGEMGLEKNAEGVPVLPGCLARFECRQSMIHDGGDHSIIVGEILRASHAKERAPLVFFEGAVRALTAKE